MSAAWFDFLAAVEAWQHADQTDLEAKAALANAATTYAAARGGASRSEPRAAGGAVFPAYGRSKGMPVAGATMQDLEFYRNGCMRTLADASKSRWHEKERALLAAIDAEIAAQGGR